MYDPIRKFQPEVTTLYLAIAPEPILRLQTVREQIDPARGRAERERWDNDDLGNGPWDSVGIPLITVVGTFQELGESLEKLALRKDLSPHIPAAFRVETLTDGSQTVTIQTPTTL